MRSLGILSMLAAGTLAAACLSGPVAPGDRDDTGVENRGAGKSAWWSALPREDWARYDRVPVDSAWFEVYRVQDGVFAIYEPGQFEEVISFLVVGSERALLFDTGLGIGDIRTIVDSLTDLDIVVVNSHTHYDHVGGNHRFEHVLGLDTAFTRKNERGTAAGELAEFISPAWVWKPFPDGFDADRYRTAPWTPVRRIAGGNVIDLGGRRIEVLATPGHAPDAVCLIDRGNRLLFTGDTFYLAPLYTHLAGSDFGEYRETAARLAGIADDVDAVLTSHNVPLVSPRYLEALDAAFAAIESGEADYVLTDGNREYDFGEFSVIVADDTDNGE